MKTPLADKLKKVLDNMTQEEFDKEWKEITKLGLKGMTFDEALKHFKPK